MTTDDIRQAAERLIREATAHQINYGNRAWPFADDALMVAPAALDMAAEIDRLRAKNERLRATLAGTVRAFNRAVEGMPGSDGALERALGAASAALAE